MAKLMFGVFCAAYLLLCGAARADIYALVVGVDQYQRLPKLTGAVNDARDIARALQGLGADVTLLVDEAATRATVQAAFRRLSAVVGADDTFVFAYAGHGVQENEAIEGDEIDGLDETIVFAAFDRSGARAGERLRDNEIGALLSSIDPGARKIVLIDSCHSGTMTRVADARGRPISTRFGGVGRIVDDPLPAPPASTRGLDFFEGRNLVYIAAARDVEQIPEVEIDGAMRGAVSWTVARVLKGVAGTDGPSMPLAAFASYVRANARALSAARQTPSVSHTPDIQANEGWFAAETLAGAAERVPTDASAAEVEQSLPRLYPIGRLAPKERAALAEETQLVTRAEDADLVWDIKQGEVVDRVAADLIGEAIAAEAVLAIIRKRAASQRLMAWASARAAELSIAPGDGRHRVGETVRLSIQRPRNGPAYLTLVNLASTGAVQFVFPDARNRAANTDVIAPGPDVAFLGEAPIVHPVGADHVVAILSPRRATRVHDLLEAGGLTPQAFLAILQGAAKEGDFKVGVTPIYTAR